MKRLNSVIIFSLIIFNIFIPDLFSSITTFDIGISYNYFKSHDYQGYNASIPVIGVSIGGSYGISPRLKIVGGYKNINPILPEFYIKEKSYFISGTIGIEYILETNGFLISLYSGISYKQTEVKMKLTLFDEFYYSYKGYRKIGIPLSLGLLKTLDFIVIGIEIDVDLIKIYSTHYDEILDSNSGYSRYERIYFGKYTDNTLTLFLKIGIHY